MTVKRFLFFLVEAQKSERVPNGNQTELKHIFNEFCTVFVEKAMAPHSSTLAWKAPWTEEPGGLQSMGSLRVGLDWAASLSLFTFMHWRGRWQPTPVFLPGESQGRGAWWAAVYGVTQNWTWLTWLSSSSSSHSWMVMHRDTSKYIESMTERTVGIHTMLISRSHAI